MKEILICLLALIICAALGIAIGDLIVMGPFHRKRAGESRGTQAIDSANPVRRKSDRLILTRRDGRFNYTERQAGESCGGYAAAYVMRHFGIEQSGREIYARMKKVFRGYVQVREVRRQLQQEGLASEYCRGDLDVLRRFLDAYGEHMEFCQLQINWFDWEFQKAKEKYELVASRGIPVWVMEPLRGGKLASLGEDFLPRLRQLRPDESAAGWAFRFLQSLPAVKMILSGMSTMQQLEENLEIFDSDAPLSGAETDVLLGIAREMAERTAVPCTGCRYCTSYCPMELDIPRLLELYNEHVFTGGGFLAPMALGAMPEDKRPSSCIGCGACAAVCPQSIDIPGALADFCERL